jgi:hypothetical protein
VYSCKLTQRAFLHSHRSDPSLYIEDGTTPNLIRALAAQHRALPCRETAKHFERDRPQRLPEVDLFLGVCGQIVQEKLPAGLRGQAERAGSQ